MSNSRMKNANWLVSDDDGKSARTATHCLLAVLMDLRDELQAIRARLDCHETLEIPRTLRRICRNTTKPKKGKR